MLNAKEMLEEIMRLADNEIKHWNGLAKKRVLLKGRCFRNECLAKAKEAGFFKLAANSLKGRAKGD